MVRWSRQAGSNRLGQPYESRHAPSLPRSRACTDVRIMAFFAERVIFTAAMERTINAEIILDVLKDSDAKLSMDELVDLVAKKTGGAPPSVIKGSILPLVSADRVKMTPERKLYVLK